MAPFWHRWSYFSIINLSVFHLADKCFTIANLINLRIILFLEYRKTPETQGFWGILRLDTECTPDTQFISSYNYSMIVATRPDPTVRPPSRIAKGSISETRDSTTSSLIRCGVVQSFPTGTLLYWEQVY